MKYDLEIRVEEKIPVVPMNFDIPDKTAREFRRITKTVLKTTMSKVMTQMMNEFIKEYETKGTTKHN